MVQPLAPAKGDFPPGPPAFAAENGKDPECGRKSVALVWGGNRHYDLEFARQIGLTIDRFDNFFLAAGDTLAVEPDLAIGRRARRQMVGECACQLDRFGVRA